MDNHGTSDGPDATGPEASRVRPLSGPRSTKRVQSGKVQLSVYVPDATARTARAAARGVAGRVAGISTLSELVAKAIDREVTHLQDEHNGGEPFPDTDERLPPGSRPR